MAVKVYTRTDGDYLRLVDEQGIGYLLDLRRLPELQHQYAADLADVPLDRSLIDTRASSGRRPKDKEIVGVWRNPDGDSYTVSTWDAESPLVLSKGELKAILYWQQ